MSPLNINIDVQKFLEILYPSIPDVVLEDLCSSSFVAWEVHKTAVFNPVFYCFQDFSYYENTHLPQILFCQTPACLDRVFPTDQRQLFFQSYTQLIYIN